MRGLSGHRTSISLFAEGWLRGCADRKPGGSSAVPGARIQDFVDSFFDERERILLAPAQPEIQKMKSAKLSPKTAKRNGKVAGSLGVATKLSTAQILISKNCGSSKARNFGHHAPEAGLFAAAHTPKPSATEHRSTRGSRVSWPAIDNHN